MIKINKFKKQTDRLLVVSEKKLYKVDAAKIKVQINRATWQPGYKDEECDGDGDYDINIIQIWWSISGGENIIMEMTMNMVMQVMREEGLEQVTGLSCGSGDNQMVSLSLFVLVFVRGDNQMASDIVTTL